MLLQVGDNDRRRTSYKHHNLKKPLSERANSQLGITDTTVQKPRCCSAATRQDSVESKHNSRAGLLSSGSLPTGSLRILEQGTSTLLGTISFPASKGG